MRRSSCFIVTLGFIIPAAPAVGISESIFVESRQSIGTGQGTLAVALADFDGDGDLDAVTPTYVGPAFVWRNLGDGIFDAVSTPVGQIAGTTIEVGDLDGDGDIDIFFASSSGQTEPFLNDGIGAFVGTGQFMPHLSTGVASGDIDGDSDVDIFSGTLGGWTNSTITNDGIGVFEVNGGLNGQVGRGVALADLDGDGDLDVFLAVGQGASTVQFNDGTGTFVDSGQQLAAASFSDHVALADLDGDGDLDAFLGNDDLFVDNSADMVLLNDGNGFFTDTGQQLGDARTTHVALGDIDLDGDIDAVTANPFALNSVWLNDGNAQFSLGDSLGGIIEQDLQVALGDLDGDGDLDLFTNGGGNGERIYFNQSACFGDIDGDGAVNAPDLLALLAAWGTDDADADIDASGTVGTGDLLALLAAWGACVG